MMASMHTRVEGADWNDFAVEAIHSRDFVIQSPQTTFAIFVSSVDLYKLDD